MLRTVVEEDNVTNALKSGVGRYPRIWEAFDGLTWLLVRSPQIGLIVEQGREFRVHKQAGSAANGTPNLLVLYTVTDQHIRLWNLRVI
jgi:hypothetical protein